MCKRVFAFILALLLLCPAAFSEEAPPLPEAIAAALKDERIAGYAFAAENECFVLLNSQPGCYHLALFTLENAWKLAWRHNDFVTHAAYPCSIIGGPDNVTIFSSDGEIDDRLIMLAKEKGDWLVTGFNCRESKLIFCTVGDGWHLYEAASGWEKSALICTAPSRAARDINWEAFYHHAKYLDRDCGFAYECALPCYLNSSARYPVYTGPGTHYYRAANGKAAVSGAESFAVIGRENGWLKICYEVSSDHRRLGYIEIGNDPQLLAISTALDLSEAGSTLFSSETPAAHLNTPGTVSRAAKLYDDPQSTAHYVVNIPAGTEATLLARLGKFNYVEIEIKGKLYRGLVLSSCFSNG